MKTPSASADATVRAGHALRRRHVALAQKGKGERSERQREIAEREIEVAMVSR